jgi:hypothetical protein
MINSSAMARTVWKSTYDRITIKSEMLLLGLNTNSEKCKTYDL